MIIIMEELREIVFQFFHSWVFLVILSASIVNSVITFRSYMINRSEKNEKEIEKKGGSLFMSTGAPIIGWSVYSMGFEEYGFPILNFVLAITFSLFVIFALTVYYDRWKIGQHTLDKYI